VQECWCIYTLHPSMVLQPLLGLGLPHKLPPFISICSSSPLLAARSSSIYYFCLRHLWGFLNIGFSPRWGHHPHAQSPTWRTRVSLFVWIITFDLSGLGDPASSCVTAGLALRIIWPHKPHHHIKVETLSRGVTGYQLSYMNDSPW
jgi:hypothetical protein